MGKLFTTHTELKATFNSSSHKAKSWAKKASSLLALQTQS